jgi:hypothetical protein
MRHIFAFLFLLTTGTLHAQQLRIDSMVTHEAQTHLQLFGSFGSTQGLVWLDSEQLYVSHWDNSTITCTLPSDSIWAGPVVVGVDSNRSPVRMLTGYLLTTTYTDMETSDQTDDTYSNDGSIQWRFCFRLDLLAALRDSATHYQIIPRLSAGSTSLSGGGSSTSGTVTTSTSEEGYALITPDLSSASLVLLSRDSSLTVNTPQENVLTVNWIKNTSSGPGSMNGSYYSGAPSLTEIYHMDTSYTMILAAGKCSAAGNFGEEFMGTPTQSDKVFANNLNPIYFPPPIQRTQSSVALAPSASFSLSIAPNPVSDHANIELTLSTADYAKIELVDVSGHALKTVASGMMSGGRHRIALDTHDLPSGVYICKATVGGGVKTMKLVKVE